jgi:excisionase family DNA binding protein
MNMKSNVGVLNPDLLFQNRIVCEWLTTKEAASYLGVSANALRILVCRGKVQAFKLGQRLRFRISDLRSLLHPNGGSK